MKEVGWTFLLFLRIPELLVGTYYCQAQPQLNSTSTQIKAEVTLNPNFSASHPPDQPTKKVF